MIGLARGEVKIAAHDASWAQAFALEKELLEQIFGKNVVAIEHIGSTAVPGLSAKPIIDIEVGIARFADWPKLVPLAEKAGYIFMPDRVFVDYIFMPKGSDDCRTHYLHITEYGSQEWYNVIHFRDILRTHTDVRKQYSTLKQSLAQTHPKRADYTAAKTEFIKHTLSSFNSV